uniref:Uncharacterized protein n=1 Tax=Avena sativa TaxID=4498 RepID=A0ACD5X9I4_AVESA
MPAYLALRATPRACPAPTKHLTMSSSLASSSYRRRILDSKVAATHALYSSRLPSRSRQLAHTRIGAATRAHGVESSIISVLTMHHWETLNHMAYKFGKLDKCHGKLALKILGSIVQQSGLERIAHIYCMAAHILIQAQMHSQAMTVLKNLAVEAFSCSDIFSSLLRTISRCDSSPMVFDLLINAYLKERKVVDASKAILLMDACGFSASAHSCNNVLNALVDIGESKHVWFFLKESLARKFPLDVVTCNIVLNSFCIEGNLKKANLMLQKMKSRSLTNVVTYNTILYWYVKKGRFKAAMCVLEDMEKNCVEADVYTYNIMIDKLCRMKRSTRAYLLLKRMREDNLAPDECTYNTLIKGFFDEGKMKLAIYIFNEMLKQSLKPSLATYTTLIDGYCRNGTTDEALRVLYEMQAAGVEPSELTYSAMLNGYCKASMLGHAMNLIDVLKARGTTINRTMYTILIDGFCQLGLVSKAKHILKSMLVDGINPDVITYSVLINGMCKMGKLDEPKEVLARMQKTGVLPNEVLYTTLVCYCCKAGYVTEALKYFVDIYRRDLTANTFIHNTLLCALYGKGMIAQAEQFKQYMSRMQISFDVTSFNCIIDYYCTTENLQCVTSRDLQRWNSR